jgi:hypothetical protein
MQHGFRSVRSACSAGFPPSLRTILRLTLAGFLLIACAPGKFANAQTPSQPSPSASHPRQDFVLPGSNPPPDANDRMMMNEEQQKRANFDAANTLREREIDDEAVKLLILARDLKVQMQRVGDKPLTEKLMREAAVIELLAHDVQTKMTLVVKSN